MQIQSTQMEIGLITYKSAYRLQSWTEQTPFSFWRTYQRASRASSLVIGWGVRERSHV